VLTADCLPLLLCDSDASQVCAVHAGWRGLAAGVIEQAVTRMGAGGENLLAWLGPAIGPSAFEVGEEVVEAFTKNAASDIEAFSKAGSGRWLADIYLLARLRLMRLGVGYVGGGNYCTVTDEKHFFSYRRDGVSGRMASLIWLEE
jgi:YfiH family protein